MSMSISIVNRICFFCWILLGLLFFFALVNEIGEEFNNWGQMSVRNQIGLFLGIFLGTFLSLMFIFIVFYLIYILLDNL